jgi:uncharacterized protein (TIGR00290 family)
LHTLRQNKDVEIVGIFCTYNEKFNRVAMHGVRIDLVKKQAESLGLPLELIPIPHPCSNEAYEKIMSDFVKRCLEKGIETFAFGDLFLENVREYRLKHLKDTGINALFPLWGKNTKDLSKEMLTAGLRTQITCINPEQIPEKFAGADYNSEFLKEIPGTVDPCGENGEFHSFAFAGPMFRNEIKIKIGKTVNREGFIFTDILPA